MGTRRIRQSVEAATASAAREAARADALARAARRVEGVTPLLRDLDRLKAENSALQGLVVDLAANKAEARSKLAQLKDKYEHLLRGVSLCCPLQLKAQKAKPCMPPRTLEQIVSSPGFHMRGCCERTRNAKIATPGNSNTCERAAAYVLDHRATQIVLKS